MSLLHRFRYWRVGWKSDLFHKWTLWMARRGSAEFIPRRKGNGPLERYLDRYILFKTPRLSVNLHQFHESDPDVPHDHPWHNISIILCGTVVEFGAAGLGRLLKPWRPLYRHAAEFHRLEVIKGPVWSIFIQFRWRRDWGFMDWERGHWTPAPEFLAKHRLPPVPSHPKVRYGFFARTTYPGHGHYFKDVLDQISLERNTTFV